MSRAQIERGSGRRRRLSSLAPLFRLETGVESGRLSLQGQLRARIVGAIDSGALKPGAKLPSSRQLARELGVARNTVLLAYQQLVAEGHLESRPRRGVFVAAGRAPQIIRADHVAGKQLAAGPSPAGRKIVRVIPGEGGFRCPPDWRKYPYPFIEGRYDASLFPVAEWREASRLALGVKEVADWSVDNGEADDEMLVDEIRTKLLPRRGIAADRDEILITAGEQQALHLVTELFARPGARVGVEEPGLPDLRSLLALRRATLTHHPIDDEGLIVDESLAGCDLVHVTPSRQRPTGVTLSLARRKALLQLAEAHDFVIVEDDFECEMNYLRQALPAIRSFDRSGRVVYIASLSKVLAPGVRLGFMVAPRDVTAAARRLRNLATRRPSPNNQRTAAFFLSLGHYDAMLNRLARVYEERLIALRDALNHYRPLLLAIPAVSGGTAYWVRGPKGLDVEHLARRAEALGILIEPARHYFADPNRSGNMFRLGVTSIPSERIRPGVELLSRLILDLVGEVAPVAAAGPPLSGEEARQRLAGATLLYKTVYGDPCTIVLAPDGEMIGRAGYANEDCDRGRWWFEGDLWRRQWRSWAYGEVAEFYVRIEGARLLWLDAAGRCVDSAIIVESGAGEGSLSGANDL